jgi:hypothetical protein
VSFIAIAHDNPIILELIKYSDNDRDAYERYLDQVKSQ